VDPDLAQQLLASAMTRMAQDWTGDAAGAGERFREVLKIASSSQATPASDLREAVAAGIRESFRVETGFTGEPGETTIAALIGPPGAGKTAAIAKLAVQYGLRLRRPTLLVSTDNLRVAASEQLRGFASLLGLRFELAQSSRALGQVLEEHRGKGLILIDTPGLCAHQMDASGEMIRFFAGRADIQKHLVLPAPARCADMNRIASAYDGFRPSHLIFSRIDETAILGPTRSRRYRGSQCGSADSTAAAGSPNRARLSGNTTRNTAQHSGGGIKPCTHTQSKSMKPPKAAVNG
jgi:flagellar biosynthesis GTPase FlhF